MAALPSDLMAQLAQFVSSNGKIFTAWKPHSSFSISSCLASRISISDVVSSAYCAFVSLDKKKREELDKVLAMRDESFAQMLIRKIREKDIKNSECYNKARIDRKLFSKIIGNPQYKVQKRTAYAFAIALELSLEEACELLLKAGYAISNSQSFDLIIKFFIQNGIYEIELINEALYQYDQPLLGA